MEERVSAESVTDLRTAKFGIQKTRTSQYVFEYKNIWDPVKKRSKPLYRISVGKVIGGEVVIKDEYLQMHPELKQGDIVLQEGKPIYIGGCSVPSELFEICLDRIINTRGFLNIRAADVIAGSRHNTMAA